MMDAKRCRICDGAVFNVEKCWYEIDPLGRFWLCPSHWEGANLTIGRGGMVLYGQEGKPGWFSLGPYPYENVPEPFEASVESVLETAERLGLL